MAQTPSANGPIAEQKDIPAQTSKPEVQTSVPARVQPSPGPPPEDRYTYEKCTIMLVIQFRPQQQENGSRSVLLSVQNGTGNKEDLPLYRLLSSEEELGSLPPALTSLLEALRQELPARKLRHEQRAAKKISAGGATRPAQKSGGYTPAKDAKNKSGTATTTASPPPVPTTAHPLPKEGLVLGGIFDDL